MGRTRVAIGPNTGAVKGRDERGSSLILALVMLVAVSLIVTGLADWTLNGLRDTASFAQARTSQAALDGAMESAIQSIRYTPELTGSDTTLDASPPSNCFGSGPISEMPFSDFTNSASPVQTLGGDANIAIWCSTAWNPTNTKTTRIVTLSACPISSSASASAAATACAANPNLQAIVTFDDYPAGFGAPITGLCTSTCGTYMTLSNWAFSPSPPTLTSLCAQAAPNPCVAPTGNIQGGTSINIYGTGFTPQTTVNFVEESGGNPTSDNVSIAAPVVSEQSSTHLVATTPAIIEGTTYYVIVTTATGTTPTGTNDVFTYVPANPPAPSLAPPSGVTDSVVSTTNYTSTNCTAVFGVTISGKGLYNSSALSPPTVSFVEDTPATGSSSPASDVVVNAYYPSTNTTYGSSYNSITAVSPSLLSGETYYVTVTSPAGTTAVTSAATFEYTSSSTTTTCPTP